MPPPPVPEKLLPAPPPPPARLKGYGRKEKEENGEWKGPIRAHYPHGHWRNHQKWRLHQPLPGPKPKPKEMPKAKKVEDIRGWKWEEDKGWVKKDSQAHAKQTESGKGSGALEAPQKAEWEYKEKKNEWKELPKVKVEQKEWEDRETEPATSSMGGWPRPGEVVEGEWVERGQGPAAEEEMVGGGRQAGGQRKGQV